MARSAPADVLPRAPRVAQGQLALAHEAAAEGRYAEVFVLVGDLLSGDDDGFLAAGGSGGARRTLRAEAAALLAAVPPGPLRQWEEWYGGRAREALDAAAGGRDRDALAVVALRFPLTAAGEEAALLLACDALNRRRPVEALAWLRRLAQQGDTATSFGRQTTLLTAAAHLLAGQEDRAVDVLTRLPTTGQGHAFRLGDEEIAADDPQALLVLLAAAAGPLLQRPVEPGAAWTMFRGDHARNAASDWPGTVGRLLWEVGAGEAATAQRAVLPAGHPLVDGSLVLARSADRLMAIDAPTGRQLWEYPWGGDSTAGATTPGGVIRLGGHVAMRTIDDASRGQLAGDGQRVFLIDAPALMPAHLLARTGGPTHNRLIALSVAKEGRLEWSVGAASGEDEPALAGAFFLGPPLVHAGRLYVLAESDAELRLCTLDAATGRLEWSLLLAVPETPIANDPQRRLAGASPSLAEGVLVCPTSAGAVVAIDLAARTILWGYSYPVAADRTRRAVQIQMLRMAGQIQRPATSVDATATLADGHVLLAPVESEELLCLDLFSGELVWRRTIPDLLYVGCVSGATVVTVGEESVSAWDLRSGKPAWPDLAVELTEGAKTSGRGVRVGHSYFLPTTRSELLQVDTDTGRIEQRLPLASPAGNLAAGVVGRGRDGAVAVSLPGPVGNLVAVGPLLVSQSAEGIRAFTALGEAASDEPPASPVPGE